MFIEAFKIDSYVGLSQWLLQLKVEALYSLSRHNEWILNKIKAVLFFLS